MNFKCIIVDDEKEAVDDIENCIKLMPILEHVKSFTNPVIARDYLTDLPEPIDIVFMDMQMPKLHGLELSKLINHKVKYLVIVSAYPEYQAECYAINARRFLTKPFNFIKFELLMNSLLERILVENPVLQLREGGNKIFSVDLNKLISVEAADHLIILHYIEGQFPYSYKISQMEEDLRPSNQFIRINKSYIVSKAAIRYSDSHMVELRKGTRIPLGPKYKEAFKRYRIGFLG